MVEVPSQANNTTGRIVFDWSSPDNSYWLPCSSYVLMEFAVKKAGNASIVLADDVDLCENPGAAAITSCQHFINGTSVGLQSNVPVAKQVLTKAFMQRHVKESVGDAFNLTAARTDGFSNTALVTGFVPPLGIWNVDSGIAGRARHQLELNMQTNLVAAMVESNNAGSSKGRSLPGLEINLASIRLYCAYATPMEPIKPPSTQFVALNDLHISSQAHVANGSSTQSYQVPSSTNKIFVTSQHLNLSDSTATGATGLFGCLHDATQPPLVDYAGSQVPSRVYDNGNVDRHRAYLDLYSSTLLASGTSSYDDIGEWEANKLYLHNFPKAPDDTSTNAIVRFNANGSTKPSAILLCALHDSVLTLGYDASNAITSVNYATLS